MWHNTTFFSIFSFSKKNFVKFQRVKLLLELADVNVMVIERYMFIVIVVYANKKVKYGLLQQFSYQGRNFVRDIIRVLSKPLPDLVYIWFCCL